MLVTAHTASRWFPLLLTLITLIQIGLTPLELHFIRLLFDMGAGWALSTPPQVGEVWGAAGPILLALALTALLRYGFAVGSSYMNAVARASLGRYLYGAIAQKCLEIPLVELEQPRFHNLLQRARDAAESRVAQGLEQVLLACLHLFTAVTLVGIVVLAHPLLAFLLILALPFLFWSYATGSQNVWQMYRGQSPEVRHANYLAALMTDHQAAHEIRLFGLANHFRERWSRHMSAVHNNILSVLRRNELQKLLTGSVPIGVTIAGAWLMLNRVADGSLSIGEYVVVTTALLRFVQELDNGVWAASRLREHLLFCSDIREVLALPEQASPRGGPERLEVQRDIVFEAVHFSYPHGGGPVLRDLNLRLRVGERLALVGENGAGKTTLVKLLLGLYQPTSGRILVDGLDLHAIDSAVRSRVMAAVFQDFTRYHLTVRENIGFGGLEQLSNDAALWRALSLGGAETLVDKLPRGLETVLGKEMGETDLSGGEWQKVAISRAFMRDAQVLVLDEPTAALDPLAEAEVYARFAELASGRTVLMVSHRLGSARLADRIVVLKEGQVAEEGTHPDLLARGGEYARMFHTQASWYAERGPNGNG